MSTHQLSNQDAQTRQAIVVGLGEVLWDVFPDGARFGGAPANFACTLAGLQVDELQIGLVSGVGRDQLGEQAVDKLQKKGVITEWLSRIDRPTGTVDVELDEGGSASYSFAADTAWDAIDWSPKLDSLANKVSAVCFGTLGQRSSTSKTTIRRFLDATPENCLRVFDVNLRPPFWNDEVIVESLKRTEILKLNEDELPILQESCQIAGDKNQAMWSLIRQYSLKLIALTEGSQGATLVSANGESSHHPGIATEIVDTVGAGDAFTATLVAGLLEKMPLDKINAWAAKVAAYVCTQSGATPQLPDTLRMPAKSDSSTRQS